VRYTYDAAGIKLRKEFDPAVGSTITYDYIGGFHYKNTILEFVTTAEGRYVFGTDNRFEYHIKDHLGNVRATVFDDNGSVGDVSADDYLTFNAYVADNQPEQNYKVGSKEVQEELGSVYDYEARFYDASIRRFMNVDPLTEMMQNWTSYHYNYNNHLLFIDPYGLWKGRKKKSSYHTLG